MKWQGIEQFVKPVVPRVVDVRVLTYELTQHRRVRVVVDVVQTVQRQEHDQSLLAFHRHVVMIGHLELRHTVCTETRKPFYCKDDRAMRRQK